MLNSDCFDSLIIVYNNNNKKILRSDMLHIKL